jgi:SanA protein
VADKSNYGSLKYLKFRETIAGIKAFFEVMINKEPRFMGEKIPITGDSRKSYDR